MNGTFRHTGVRKLTRKACLPKSNPPCRRARGGEASARRNGGRVSHALARTDA